mgnify:CR=1 FL=1
MISLTLLAIVALDIRFHRIHNISIAIVLIESIQMHKFHLTVSGLIFALTLSLLLFFVRAGAGDIKFAILVLSGLISSDSFGRYLQSFLLVASIHLLIHFSITRRFSGYLPLAPALAGSAVLVIM